MLKYAESFVAFLTYVTYQKLRIWKLITTKLLVSLKLIFCSFFFFFFYYHFENVLVTDNELSVLTTFTTLLLLISKYEASHSPIPHQINKPTKYIFNVSSRIKLELSFFCKTLYEGIISQCSFEQFVFLVCIMIFLYFEFFAQILSIIVAVIAIL